MIFYKFLVFIKYLNSLTTTNKKTKLVYPKNLFIGRMIQWPHYNLKKLNKATGKIVIGYLKKHSFPSLADISLHLLINMLLKKILHLKISIIFYETG